jgi:hypothetical protein
MTDITPTQEDRDAMQSILWVRTIIDDQDAIAEAFARHRQAAIASVIARATTPDAIKRATRAINVSGKLQDAITAALTERKS